jgi:hypothetical protein
LIHKIFKKNIGIEKKDPLKKKNETDKMLPNYININAGKSIPKDLPKNNQNNKEGKQENN